MTRRITGITTKGRILALILESVETRGYPPTVRELMVDAGLKSPASVQHHLDALVSDGVISRDGVKARTIRINEMEEQ